MRVAAVGDIHYGVDERGPLGPHLRQLEGADLLLLAGDLTRHGHPEEAAILAEDLARVPVPTVAVLGNHDFHSDRSGEVAEAVRGAGATVLDATTPSSKPAACGSPSPAPRATAAAFGVLA